MKSMGGTTANPKDTPASHGRNGGTHYTINDTSTVPRPSDSSHYLQSSGDGLNSSALVPSTSTWCSVPSAKVRWTQTHARHTHKQRNRQMYFSNAGDVASAFAAAAFRYHHHPVSQQICCTPHNITHTHWGFTQTKSSSREQQAMASTPNKPGSGL